MRLAEHEQQAGACDGLHGESGFWEVLQDEVRDWRPAPRRAYGPACFAPRVLVEGSAPAAGTATPASRTNVAWSCSRARDHVADAVGLGGGQVVLLAAVGRQVEQLPRVPVFAGGHQLVVAHAQGAVALVLEEDEVAGNAAILGERRHQAAAGQRRRAGRHVPAWRPPGRAAWARSR